MSLTGKSAIVTGGNGGIGLEICKALLHEHLKNLAIIDMKGEEFIVELKKDFPKTNILFKMLDMAHKDSVDCVYEEIKNEFKQIHIVVNAIGIVNEHDIAHTVNVNICGVMYSTLAARSNMSLENKGEGGIVINISSISGLNPICVIPIYTATKFAVLGFTRSLADEFYYKKTGVKFITLCPGFTTTPLIAPGNKLALFPNDNFSISNMPMQSASDVSKSVMEILKTGKDGSVWICEDGKFRDIEIKKVM